MFSIPIINWVVGPRDELRRYFAPPSLDPAAQRAHEYHSRMVEQIKAAREAAAPARAVTKRGARTITKRCVVCGKSVSNRATTCGTKCRSKKSRAAKKKTTPKRKSS